MDAKALRDAQYRVLTVVAQLAGMSLAAAPTLSTANVT
jgi:hypothetical protein